MLATLDIHTLLESAANNPVFATDKDAVIQGLQAMKEQNPLFSTAFLVDASLTRINETGEPASLASREYMQEAQKTKKTIISREILISQGTNKTSVMIATPIKVPGALAEAAQQTGSVAGQIAETSPGLPRGRRSRPARPTKYGKKRRPRKTRSTPGWRKRELL
ncbi:MAG: hypothetical protein P4N41_18550 [Negativicutes bacterium]|nr:hypothetical protein [Negativicutes bacterium]